MFQYPERGRQWRSREGKSELWPGPETPETNPRNAQQSNGLGREIIELFRKEKPNPAVLRPTLNRVPMCHIYMSFKSLQGWTTISVKK